MLGILSKALKIVSVILRIAGVPRGLKADISNGEGHRGPGGHSIPRYSLLVPCEALIISGGLLRFERLGRKLAEQGHQLCYVPFSERADPNFQTALPVLSPNESAKRKWDAVMIPGGSFADEVIERFATFCDPRYGVRVQHILNDQSRKERYIKVNQVFRPDIVIFNNPEWVLGEYQKIRAKQFHYLFGAVDTQRFYPKTDRETHGTKESWVVGGLANKNPAPLIKALERLPRYYCVKLYGHKGELERKYATLVKEGRLQLVGLLMRDDLTTFYHSIDCIVHTEKFAGWANVVAEGMACELPVICTPHGTRAFAIHEKNAMVLDRAEPELIAEAVMRLSKNPILCERLATAGRHTMMDFTWDRYARNLLNLVFDSPARTTDGHPEPRPKVQRCE